MLQWTWIRHLLRSSNIVLAEMGRVRKRRREGNSQHVRVCNGKEMMKLKELKGSSMKEAE